jgi:hypothetical protein
MPIGVRKAFWNMGIVEREIFDEADKRITEAGEIVAKKTRENLKKKIGRGDTKNITRPVYKTGAYAGQSWTARTAGDLMASIRVVKKHGLKGNVWIMVGNDDVWWGPIFEFYNKPFLRPALSSSKAEIKRVLLGV